MITPRGLPQVSLIGQALFSPSFFFFVFFFLHLQDVGLHDLVRDPLINQLGYKR